MHYLDKVDPEAARVARERYGCLVPWRAEPARYGRMALSRGYAVCEKPVADALTDLLRKRLDYLSKDGEAFFDAEQNARIVAGAEQYYRAIYYGDAASWNLRDQHMFDTLERLLAERGPEAKAVVWAHNSHIGNASLHRDGPGARRAQYRAARAPALRRRCGADRLRHRSRHRRRRVGLGRDDGDQARAPGPRRFLRGPLARRPASPPSCSRPGRDKRRAVRAELAEPLLERAIGVIYRPETELLSHYFQAELSRQFDAWIWFEETEAVAARPVHAHGPDETYPFGL